MRILCLNLQQSQDPSCAEVFLKFSPRVQFRYPHYVFVDIESTAMLFSGEFALLKKAVDAARVFSPTSTGAIADSAGVAQMLVNFRPFEITKPGEDMKAISKLPVASLLEMEGLVPWPRRRSIEHITDFFQSLGLDWVEDVLHFEMASMRERWGEAGSVLWQRLHGQEFQVISPLVPQDPLVSYGHFDDAVDLMPVLMEKLRVQMRYLFLRLDGLSRFAQRLELTLHCEYSDHRHYVSVEPVSPSRDVKLFEDLLIKKLEKLDLQNPVREFEVHVFDVPEKISQLDFFEPRDTTEDRWKRLISFARQAQVDMGFLQREASLLPEESYTLKTDWPEKFSSKDLVEWQEGALQVKAVYGKNLGQSPRPSLLLKEPLPLTGLAKDHLKFLTRVPIERIQNGWWKKNQERDYYFALSREGQLLWVYQDLKTEKYFLHGYFD